MEVDHGTNHVDAPPDAGATLSIGGPNLFDEALDAALQVPGPQAGNNQWALHASAWYLVSPDPRHPYDLTEWKEWMDEKWLHLRDFHEWD